MSEFCVKLPKLVKIKLKTKVTPVSVTGWVACLCVRDLPVADPGSNYGDGGGMTVCNFCMTVAKHRKVHFMWDLTNL